MKKSRSFKDEDQTPQEDPFAPFRMYSKAVQKGKRIIEEYKKKDEAEKEKILRKYGVI